MFSLLTLNRGLLRLLNLRGHIGVFKEVIKGGCSFGIHSISVSDVAGCFCRPFVGFKGAALKASSFKASCESLSLSSRSGCLLICFCLFTWAMIWFAVRLWYIWLWPASFALRFRLASQVAEASVQFYGFCCDFPFLKSVCGGGLVKCLLVAGD